MEEVGNTQRLEGVRFISEGTDVNNHKVTWTAQQHLWYQLAAGWKHKDLHSYQQAAAFVDGAELSRSLHPKAAQSDNSVAHI